MLEQCFSPQHPQAPSHPPSSFPPGVSQAHSHPAASLAPHHCPQTLAPCTLPPPGGCKKPFMERVRKGQASSRRRECKAVRACSRHAGSLSSLSLLNITACFAPQTQASLLTAPLCSAVQPGALGGRSPAPGDRVRSCSLVLLRPVEKPHPQPLSASALQSVN